MIATSRCSGLGRLVIMVLLGSFIAGAIVHEPGRCTTYGAVIDPSMTGDASHSAADNRLAMPPDASFDVSELCPSLIGTHLCCDRTQFEDLKAQIGMANGLLSRCGACIATFTEFFCQYTCSPNQSTFKKVTSTRTNPQNVSIVASTEYLLSSEYANAIWDSCKDVKFGAMGGKVMKQIFQSSNVWDWFAFLGRDVLNGGASPEQIDFPRPWDPSPLPRGMLPLQNLSSLVIACNDQRAEYTCSCSDCDASCPVSSSISFEAERFANRDDEMFFFSLAIPVCSSFILLFVLWFYRLNNARPADHEESDQLVPVRGLRRADNNPQRHRFLTSKSSVLSRIFFKIGSIVGHYPFTVICASILLSCILGSMAIIWLHTLTDPVSLWTSPQSQSVREKNKFDSTFGPFFRVEQIIIKRSDEKPILPYASEIVPKLQEMTDRIASLRSDTDVTLDDLCFRLAPGQGCVVQSILNFFDNFPTISANSSDANDALKHVIECANSMTDKSCLDKHGLPTLPTVVLGGISNENYGSATSVIVTYLLEGAKNQTQIKKAESWERHFLSVLRDELDNPFWSGPYAISYSTEQSLETELNSQVNANAKTIMASYLIMFAYIAFALGNVVLAVSGIFVVILSLIASLGFCAVIGIDFTMIISEVIPFLVLAIGIDNIFIIVKEFNKQSKQNLEPKTKLAETMSIVGPSICLSSLCEATAFLLGMFTTMPAVRSFAIYSAVAIAANFALQITCFCAALVIDAQRPQDDRSDGIFCFSCFKQDADDMLMPASRTAIDHSDMIDRFVDRILCPTLSKNWVKFAVILLFAAMSFASMYLFRYNLELGLDPSVALPSHSYLQSYLYDVQNTLSIGPPVYFVVDHPGIDAIDIQNKVCDLPHCDQNNLGEIMSLASSPQHKSESYIAVGVSSWIDDYLQWLNAPAWANSVLGDNTARCCRRHFETGQFCQHHGPDSNCHPCIDQNGLDMYKRNMVTNGTVRRPLPEAFNELLPGFLNSTCDVNCTLCATPHLFNMAFRENSTEVTASKFASYHTVLHTQKDFISAMKSTRSLSAQSPVSPYPYSVFYVYFEQYLTIEFVAFSAIMTALFAVFLICLIEFRSLVPALIVPPVIAMITIDLIGLMTLANCMLNGVSLVNILMCVGISVEFCIPVLHYYYMRTSNEMHANFRMTLAIRETGSSLIRGILITKILGTSILFLSPTPLIAIYYARMFMLICLLGGLHGFILLPVALTLINPSNKRRPQQSLKEALLASIASQPNFQIFNEEYENGEQQ